ncbi:MAG: 3'(2'),5'-bisphosphate nucleotidase [Planctomycetota bacterium]
MSDHARLAEVGREAVVAASMVCKAVQRRSGEVRAISKDDKSPVTVADFASQAVVCRILRDELGTDAVIAEEGSDYLREADHKGELDAVLEAVRVVWPEADESAILDAIDIGSNPPKGSGFWTLDPIDGTKGFLRNQQFAVALGYIERGEPAIGVMGCPNLPVDMSLPLDEPDEHGCLYYAVRGQGVYETRADDPDAETIRITRLDHDEADPIAVCASVEKAHSNASDTDRMLAWVVDQGLGEVGEPVRLDSQCKYAVVARGQADAYLRLPTRKGYREKIWDHGAGAMIAAESGAAVTDIHGRDLDFSLGETLAKNVGVVCAPPRVHGVMLRAIEALGIDEPK